MVNYARNLARLLLVFSAGKQDGPMTPLQHDLAAVAVRWIAASVHILRGHLREQTNARWARAQHRFEGTGPEWWRCIRCLCGS